jgi:hypothetical protein
LDTNGQKKNKKPLRAQATQQSQQVIGKRSTFAVPIKEQGYSVKVS